MMGKFLLLALVCVAVAQVQGDRVLENAIKRGLLRTASINRNGQRRIEAAINEVSYKKKLIEAKASDFIQKTERVQDSFEDALHNVAETIREKARESNKPNSVFECIDRVEENGNKNVEGLVRKFRTDIQRIERVKLENIDTYAKPLGEMSAALTVRYQRADSIIRDCQNPQCVDIAINSFARWLDSLFSEISRINSQINIALGNFQRDVTTNFNNTNRQITRIKAASLQNIRACLYNREALFGGN